MSWWSKFRERVNGLGQIMLRGIFPAISGDPPAIGTEDLLEGYDSMPWLRAAAEKSATAVACLDWTLYAIRRGGKAVRDAYVQRAIGAHRDKALSAYRESDELEEIKVHPFYEALENPNPYMGRVGLLKITEIHLDLVGDAYWLKDRNRLGTVVGFWPVPPHWILEHPIPGRQQFLVGYRSWQAMVPVSEVVWFHEPSPVHPFTRGSGIGWTLGDELEVDEYAAKMARQFFYNRARPDFLFMGGEGTSEPEMKRLERDWTSRLQGFWRAHKPYFMSGGGDDVRKHVFEFQQPTMEQLVYPNLRKAQRDIVLQVWGDPPELHGILENSNRATIEAAEYLFTKWVVAPKGERMRTFLQKLVMEYDERLIIHFPSPVMEDKEHLLNVRKVAPWAYLVDEWRALAGEKPLPDGRGQVLILPMNSYGAADPADQEARPESKPAALPAAEKAGDVHLHLPESMDLKIPSPTVVVQPPTVLMPPQPPEIRLLQAPPVPEPKAKKTRRTVQRDRDGRILAIEDEEIAG